MTATSAVLVSVASVFGGMAAAAMATDAEARAAIDDTHGGSQLVGARYLALALAGTVIAVYAIAACVKKGDAAADRGSHRSSIFEAEEPETFLHNGVSTHGMQRSPMKLNEDGSGIRMTSMRRHNPLAGTKASVNGDSSDDSETEDRQRSSVRSKDSSYSGFGGASIHSNASKQSRPPSTYEDEMIKEAMRLGFGRAQGKLDDR